MDAGAGRRVLVSHAGPDTGWAEWVAWQLDAAGYQVELDRWDWETGSNFVFKMEDALEAADAVVAVWSAAYFEPGRFTGDEWTAVFAARDKLVPVRVERVTPPKLLGPLLYRDLFSKPEEAARRELLDAMRAPGKPSSAPVFPGAPPPAPAGGPRLPGVLPTIWNVPPRSPAFVGRDRMLAELRETLSTESRVAVQALHGMGGVGKSLLAVEFAHRFAGDYDLVWWIDAEQVPTIGDRYATLAIKLNLVDPDADVPAALDAVRGHLRQVPRWLVIFDNAEDPAALRAWLPEGPGRALVTSRNPRWREVAAIREVDVFARPESVKLLREQAPTLNKADAHAIANAVGDLPLALAQAAGVISGGLTAAQYRTALQSEVAALLDSGVPATYSASLAATVRIALNRADDTNPVAAEMARVYSFLAAEPIPPDWVIKAAASAPDTLPAQLAEAAHSPLRLTQATTVLARHGLVRSRDVGTVMHRLTGSIIRASLTGDQIPGYRRAAEAVVLAAVPGDPVDPATWPDWAILLPHLRDLPLDTDRPAIRGLATSAAWSLFTRGEYVSGRDYTTPLYQRWRTTLGPDHPDTLTSAHHLANDLRGLRELQAARKLDEDTLVRRRRVLGEDHRDTLRSANNLAIDLRRLGDVQRARQLDEDTLARRRRVLGEDHRDTLRSAGNLAIDLRRLGEVQRARQLDEDTLARQRRVLGEDHPHTLSTAYNLANDLSELGELEAARQLDEDTLARIRRVLGEDHPETLRAAGNLAIVLRRLGDVQQARQLDEDTLARRRRVLGEDHPDTLMVQNRLTGNDADSSGSGSEPEQERPRESR
jgi:hypothetical protein